MKIEPRQVTTSLRIQLDPTATLLGVAQCSSGSNSCTAVQRRDNGDLVLANHVGLQFVVPAAEVMATAALMLKTTESSQP
jgi:hypothetical protein